MLMNEEDFSSLIGIKGLSVLHLEVSLGCNISCAMCTFHDTLKKFRMMSIQDLKKIKTGFNPFGRIHIGDGSEPFINPDFIDIVRFFSDRGIMLSAQTNAKSIRTAADAEKIVTSGLNFLSISLDGTTDLTVRKIRGGLGFSEISRAIDLINEAKCRLGFSTPYLASNAVAMRCNLEELPDLAIYFLNNNFSFFRIGFLELRKPNSDLAGELLIYDMPRATGIVNQIKKLIENHPQPMYFDDGIFKKGVGLVRRENCTGYKDRFYVNHSGDMWTCYGKQRLGNIFESSMEELVCSDGYEEYKKIVTTPGNSVCNECTFCQIMSLDKISDHFGKRAIEHYSLPVIEKSIQHSKMGGDVREFWKEYK